MWSGIHGPLTDVGGSAQMRAPKLRSRKELLANAHRVPNLFDTCASLSKRRKKHIECILKRRVARQGYSKSISWQRKICVLQAYIARCRVGQSHNGCRTIKAHRVQYLPQTLQLKIRRAIPMPKQNPPFGYATYTSIQSRI